MSIRTWSELVKTVRVSEYHLRIRVVGNTPQTVHDIFIIFWIFSAYNTCSRITSVQFLKQNRGYFNERPDFMLAFPFLAKQGDACCPKDSRNSLSEWIPSSNWWLDIAHALPSSWVCTESRHGVLANPSALPNQAYPPLPHIAYSPQVFVAFFFQIEIPCTLRPPC